MKIKCPKIFFMTPIVKLNLLVEKAKLCMSSLSLKNLEITFIQLLILPILGNVLQLLENYYH